MARPKLENGYSKIANEILEAMVRTPFNATQFRIILVIWRYTYGFNRKEHEISETFLVKATGISKRYVSSELNKLIDMRVMNLVKPSTYTKPKTLSFNKNYEEWVVDSRTKVQQVNNPSTVEELIDTTVEQSFHSPVEQLFTSTVEQSFHQEIKILKKDLKESIKKEERKENPLLPILIPVEKVYQENIGLLTPIIAQSIAHWLDDGVEEALLAKYIEVAVKRNKRSWGYIEAMIRGNYENNIKTLEQYEAMLVEKEKHPTNNINSKTTPAYADFEQRDYSDIDMTKFYANLND